MVWVRRTIFSTIGKSVILSKRLIKVWLLATEFKRTSYKKSSEVIAYKNPNIIISHKSNSAS